MVTNNAKPYSWVDDYLKNDTSVSDAQQHAIDNGLPDWIADYKIPEAKPVAPQLAQPTLSENLGDTGRLLLQGVEGVGGVVGYGLEKSGIAPQLGRTIQESSLPQEARLQSHLTPQMQEAQKQPLINEADDGALSVNPDFGFRSLEANVLPSIPSTVAMGVAGAPLAALGTSAATAAGVGKALAPVIGSGLGFGASEGVFSGAQNAEQWGHEQRAKPVEVFKQHPAWNKALADNGNDPEAAKEALINKGQSDIFKDTAIKTGGLSAVTGGGVLGVLNRSVAKPVIGEVADGFLKSTVKGIASEAGQEAPQSYFEQKTTNQATKDYVDPNQDVNEGALNAGVVGGISGGVMGAFGGAGALLPQKPAGTTTATESESAPTINPIVEQAQAEADTAVQEHQSQQAQGNTLGSAAAAANAKVAQDRADTIKADSVSGGSGVGGGTGGTAQDVQPSPVNLDTVSTLQPIVGNAQQVTNTDSQAIDSPKQSQADNQRATDEKFNTDVSAKVAEIDAKRDDNVANTNTINQTTKRGGFKPRPESVQQAAVTLAEIDRAIETKTLIPKHADDLLRIAPTVGVETANKPIHEIQSEVESIVNANISTEPTQAPTVTQDEPTKASKVRTGQNKTDSAQQSAEVPSVSSSDAKVSTQTAAVKPSGKTPKGNKDAFVKEWVNTENRKAGKKPRTATEQQRDTTEFTRKAQDEYDNRIVTALNNGEKLSTKTEIPDHGLTIEEFSAPLQPSNESREAHNEAIAEAKERGLVIRNKTSLTNDTPTDTAQPATQGTDTNSPAVGITSAQEEKSGVVGGEMATGQVVLTSTGRKTTPYPKFNLYEHKENADRTAIFGRDVAKTNNWLIENAILEAESRGDDLTKRIFQADYDRYNDKKNKNRKYGYPAATKDHADEYLFGEVMPQRKSILKPLSQPTQATNDQSQNATTQETDTQAVTPSTTGGNNGEKTTTKNEVLNKAGEAKSEPATQFNPTHTVNDDGDSVPVAKNENGVWESKDKTEYEGYDAEPIESKVASQAKPETYHPAISSLANELVVGGGVSYTYDENGKINGRTPSTNPDWFKDGAFVALNKNTGNKYSGNISVKEIQTAVSAYEDGGNLTDKQRAILRGLSSVAEELEDAEDNNHPESYAYEDTLLDNNIQRYDRGDEKARAEAVNKFSDLHFSKANQSTNAHTLTSFTQSFTAQLDKQFGRGWTKLLMATGKVKVISSEEAIAMGVMEKAQAFYATSANSKGLSADTTYFIADNIDKNKDLLGLALHEIASHQLNLGKDDKAFQDILGELARMRKSSKLVQDAYVRALESFGLSSLPIADSMVESVNRNAYSRGDILAAKSTIKKLFDQLKVINGSSVSRGMKPSANQSSFDSSSTAIKFLSDTLKGHSSISKAFNSGSVDKGMMLDAMSRIAQDNKIINSIIEFIPVDVMDMLVSRQFTPDMLRHDMSMGVDLNTVDRNNPIASTINSADSVFMAIVHGARLRAKYNATSSFNSGRSGVNNDTAPSTRNINTSSNVGVSKADRAGITTEFTRSGNNSPALDTMVGTHNVIPNNDVELDNALSEIGVLLPSIVSLDDVNNEVISYLLEYHPKLSFSQKFLNWFRNKLRAIGKALPPVQRTEWFRRVTAISDSDLVGMAVSALRFAPNDLLFDSVGRSGDAIKLAKQQGYEGSSTGEAEEWLRAVAKGLDMSQEARMARAKDMGFDVDTDYYHGSHNFGSVIDMSNYGNGEGGQGFGYGFHVTKTKDTAKDYWHDLGDKKKKIYNLYLKNDVYLDWHLPLSKQSKDVINVLKEANISISSGVTGEELYYDIASLMGGEFDGDLEASYFLDSIGIQGIQYTDRIAVNMTGEDIDEDDIDNYARENGHINRTVFNPNNIRSPDAAFDPDFADSPNLLASKKDTVTSPLLAPNGLPSKLNAMQHAQVRTPEFKAWFGDFDKAYQTGDYSGVSRVIDENGEPLVVYHGTGADFSEFKKSEKDGFLGVGIYLSRDKLKASGYAEIKENGNVMPVFIRSLNPLIEKNLSVFEDKHWIDDVGFPEMGVDNNYDSYVIGDMSAHEFKEIVIANPNQIKSATGNTGAFSQDNNDIRFSKAPKIWSRAFFDWWNGSKFSGKDGQPVKFYHGSNSTFNEFSHAKIGTGTPNHSTSGLGFFFSPQRETATHYGSDVREFYLSAQKVKGMTVDQLPQFDSIEEAKAYADKLKKQGFDAIYLTDAKYAIVFESNQAKLTSNDEPTQSPDIRYSMASDATVGDNYTLPAETKLQHQQRLWQDENNRWTVLQNVIKKAGGFINDANDVYTAMELMPHKAADRVAKYHQAVTKPIFKRMTAIAATKDDVALLLYARHAKERNAEMAKINPRFATDGGSGMTDAQADFAVTQLQEDYGSKFAELERIAKDLQGITNSTLDILESTGVYTPEQAQAMRDTYANYVPLKGFEVLDEAGNKTNGTGLGFSTARSFGKRALGRSSKAGQIFENILRDHERAIVWSEKTKVAETLGNLVDDNPDDKIYTKGVAQTKPALVKGKRQFFLFYNGSFVGKADNAKDMRTFRDAEIARTGQDRKDYRINIIKSDDKVGLTPAPFDAEKEVRYIKDGKEVRIQIKDPLLLQSFNKLDRDVNNGVFAAAQTFNSFLRQAWTAKNPAFFLINPIRDVQTAGIVLTGEGGVSLAASAMKNWGSSWRTMMAHAREKPASSPEEQAMLERYLAAGGSVSTAYIGSLEKISDDIHRELQRNGGESVSSLVASGNYKEAMKSAAFRALNNKLFDAIEHLNAAFEGATRLATFKAAINAGYSDTQAAKLSSNVTVNFTKKGEYGSQLGSMFLFANANIQGNSNVFKTLTQSKHKKQAQALVGGLVALGFMAAMSAGDDGDDDLISDNEKERNISIDLGDGHRATIPLPYGFSFFRDIGRALAQVANGGDIEKISKKLASTFLGNFSPIGNPIPQGDLSSDNAIVAFAPTFAKPFIMPAVNKGSFGTPLMPDSPFKKSQPDSEKVYRKTRGGWQDIAAKGLNSLTGGDEAKSGWIDISPETIKNTVNYIAGGAGRFVTDSFDDATMAVNGEDVSKEKLPIAKSFFKATTVDDYRRRFYAQYDEVSQAHEQLKVYQSAKNQDGVKELRADSGDLLRLNKMADMTKKQLNAIRTREDKARSIGNKAMIDSLEKQEIVVLERFNKRFG